MKNTEIIADVENDATAQLTDTLLINEIRRLKTNEAYWDIFTKEQRRELLATIKGSALQPTIVDITNSIYQVRDAHGIKLSTGPVSSDDKKEARRQRRLRRKQAKMENGENGTAAATTRKIRGGATTMVLQNDSNGEIVRFRIRKKGAPKYEATSEVKQSFTINGETRTFIFNPSDTKVSVRAGFRDGDNWFFLDNEEFSTMARETEGLAFTKLEAGTEIPAAGGEEGEGEAEAKPKRSRKKKAAAEPTDEESGEVESNEESAE